ncbi:MAG: lipid A deacylase LpxR family protein [Burkholderiaceae bacterium]
MRYTKFNLMAVGLLFAVSTQSSAEGMLRYLDDFSAAKSEGKATTKLDVDNDSLMFSRKDGFYTGGLHITQQYMQRDAEQTSTYGWRIGQDMYTPSDVKLLPQSIGRYDHPYAGWLYNGFFKEIHRVDGTSSRVGLDVGCMGPCSGAEHVQTNFHRLLHQPLPQGWSTQMKNEVGAIIYGDLAPVSWRPASWADVTPNLHGRFGNIFTDVGGGVTLRAGDLPALPDQATLHGFLRLDASAIGYNAMLQGGYFSRNNSRTVDPKRWVGEAELGMAWNHAPYGVSASVVRRSNEIRGLPNSVGAENFARLIFSYTP